MKFNSSDSTPGIDLQYFFAGNLRAWAGSSGSTDWTSTLEQKFSAAAAASPDPMTKPIRQNNGLLTSTPVPAAASRSSSSGPSPIFRPIPSRGRSSPCSTPTLPPPQSPGLSAQSRLYSPIPSILSANVKTGRWLNHYDCTLYRGIK